MGKDLGTYYVRVELQDGHGWIHQWCTGQRWTDGSWGYSPLDASAIPPVWASEAALLSAIEWQYFEGNFACDCNKAEALAYASRLPLPDNPACGNTMPIAKLTVLCPGGREVVLLEEGCAESS